MRIIDFALPSVSNEKYFFSFLAVFMMLGNVYVFSPLPVLAWGEVLFIVFIPYFIIKQHKRITISNSELGFVLFMLYGFIISIVACVAMQASVSSVTTRLSRDFFYYFIILFLGTKFYSKDLFFRLINVFCSLLGIYVILQSLIFLITGYYVPGFILSARINDGNHYGRELYSRYLSYSRIAGYFRPNGFLCEPAHCAQCFFVDLIILLFCDGKKNKKLLLNAGLISCAALLTMSTSAIVYIIVTWFIWMLKEGKRNVLKVAGLVFLLSIIILVAYSRGSLSNYISVTERLTNVLTGDSITNSASLRLMKGIDIYGSLPIGYKLFGIGFGTYTSAVDNSIISSSIANSGNEYMNSFSYLLVSSGLVGGCIYLFLFINLFYKNSFLGKVMIFALLVVSLGSSIYSSPFCVWTMLIILNDSAIYKSEICK